MDWLVSVIVQCVTGIIGGQAVGIPVRQARMDRLPKMISGAVGGFIGGLLLDTLLTGSGVSFLTHGLLGDALGGLIGGALLTGIVGTTMGAMNRR